MNALPIEFYYFSVKHSSEILMKAIKHAVAAKHEFNHRDFVTLICIVGVFGLSGF